MDNLLQEFILETRETLDTLSSELVAWEADPSDKARLDSIFRFFHTIKGSCGFLNQPRFERLSHSAEDVLSQLRDGECSATPELVGAILAIIDRIADLIQVLESGEALPDGSDYDLIEALNSTVGSAPDRDVTAQEPDTPDPDDAGQEGVEAPRQQDPHFRSIRIPLDLLDRVMNGVSDLVLARNEVARCIRDSDHDATLDGAFERLSGCIADIRDSIGQTRMQRVDRIFSPLYRLVRDLNNELGKSVNLTTAGGEVELDREMIEMIRDPLMHIIRNAIDHGIESPEDRRELGKPETGQLRIAARQSGNQIIIDIADDGSGIDLEKLASKAVSQRLRKSSEAARMTDAAKLDLIFAPGLSTASEVTAISGRGVGMDVVRSNIERIGGTVVLDNCPGEGLKVSVRVPLTLTIIACLTIEVNGECYALPRASIREILHGSNDQVEIQGLGGSQVAFIRGKGMPHIRLEDLLGLPCDSESAAGRGRTIISINASSDIHYALSVTNVLDHEELVIRPGVPLVMATGLYAGTTLPDNGRPMLMLDPMGLASKANISTSGDSATQDREAEDGAGSANTVSTVPTLHFSDFDGRRCAIPLGVLERLEDVAAEEIFHSAGENRVMLDGSTMPVFGVPDNTFERGARIQLLRLSDGASEICYAVDQVFDIFDYDQQLQPARSEGHIAGVALVDGKPVEIIDTHWIFASLASVSQRDANKMPLAFIAGSNDGWVENILAPLLRSSGYSIASGEQPPADAAVFVRIGDSDLSPPSGARVISISNERDQGDAIYRYDRAALSEALQMPGLREKRA